MAAMSAGYVTAGDEKETSTGLRSKTATADVRRSTTRKMPSTHLKLLINLKITTASWKI